LKLWYNWKHLGKLEEVQIAYIINIWETPTAHIKLGPIETANLGRIKI